jgi:hypothetical protein
MAGEEQLLVAATAKAEPEECSRWAVTCLLGGAGAALLCFSFYLVMNESEIMVFFVGAPMMFLGLFLAVLCLVSSLELCTGGDPYGRMSVDDLLFF